MLAVFMKEMRHFYANIIFILIKTYKRNKTEKIFSPSLPRRTDKTEKEIILVMTTNFLN